MAAPFGSRPSSPACRTVARPDVMAITKWSIVQKSAAFPPAPRRPGEKAERVIDRGRCRCWGRMRATLQQRIAGCRKRRVRVAQEVQAIFFRRRHQPRRPPLAKIRPGRHRDGARDKLASDLTTRFSCGVDIRVGQPAFDFPRVQMGRELNGGCFALPRRPTGPAESGP